MNLWRWNKGIAHDVVVQQSLPKGAPEWVKRCEVPRRKGGDITHGMINDADTLRWLAQQNCITPHVWNARCDLREKPDRLVFDLDPSEDDFDKIRAAALAVADMLRDIGLTPFAKVSGSARDPRGRAAEAAAGGGRGPGRGGRAGRADRGRARRTRSRPSGARTSATDGFSWTSRATRTGRRSSPPTRSAALHGAPVSAPVTWDEVADPALTPQAFTLRTWGTGSRRSGTCGRTSTSTRARCRKT